MSCSDNRKKLSPGVGRGPESRDYADCPSRRLAREGEREEEVERGGGE